jgi:hypothetical protein
MTNSATEHGGADGQAKMDGFLSCAEGVTSAREIFAGFTFFAIADMAYNGEEFGQPRQPPVAAVHGIDDASPTISSR